MKLAQLETGFGRAIRAWQPAIGHITQALGRIGIWRMRFAVGGVHGLNVRTGRRMATG